MSATLRKMLIETQEGRDAESAAGVNALARKALSVLAARRSSGRAISEDYLTKMREAVASPNPASRWQLIDAMEDAGVSRAEICDVYIPELARRMGEDWCADKMSFADVSIGAARLQAMLREIVPAPDDLADGPGSNVVVLVLASEQHTLGAMVLTGQLRRIGVSVRLVMGRPTPDIIDMVRGGDFDGILVSAAKTEDLNDTSTIIQALRAVKSEDTPMIIGGPLLEVGEEEAKRLTGAEHATNDLMTALALCCKSEDMAARN